MTTHKMARVFAPVLFVFSSCGTSEADDKRKPAHQKFPTALVGEWKFEQLGDVKCDAAGRCHPTIARRESLALTADGRFTYSLYAESHFPPCKLVGHAQGVGTAHVSGTTLDLRVREGFVKRQDSCGKSSSTNERGKHWTYKFALASDDTLVLTNDEGTQVGPYKRK